MKMTLAFYLSLFNSHVRISRLYIYVLSVLSTRGPGPKYSEMSSQCPEKEADIPDYLLTEPWVVAMPTTPIDVRDIFACQ